MSQFRIVSREEWGARYGRGNDVSSKLPWGEVVFHTEAGAIRKEDWAKLADLAHLSLTEAQHMRAIENFHVNTRGWQGIAYTFVIMFDGTICEGRGWGRQGAHTETRNTIAAGICFQGHGDLQPATAEQMAAAKWLIGEGIRLGKLKSNPKVSSHSDYSLKGKTCCGLLIRPHLGEFRGITGPQDAPAKPVRHDLREGDSGPRVGMLQGCINVMILAGFVKHAGLRIDPKVPGFGPLTKDAVKALQQFGIDMQKLAGQKVTIKKDGVAGQDTFGIISAFLPAAWEKISEYTDKHQK